MKTKWFAAGAAAALTLTIASLAGGQAPAPGAQAARPQRDYPVKPVPFTAVHFNDIFWAPRIEINRTVTIPFAFQKCEESGRIDNFERAAAALKGEPLQNTKPPGYPFDDTDPYKVIEGACYTLSVHPDPKLETYVDNLIQKIGAAQEKDGYLYTTRSINPEKPHSWAGTRRWELEGVDSHELYNLGHLYEAAVAHFQATGKRSLLDIALRTAELLDRTFGPGKQSIWPGHQITEMGLAKLYRVTGDERYLQLAKFLLDARGPDGTKGSGRQYNQSHAKVVDQTAPVGHAVRATYMYSGIADVAALTGDESYIKALDKIWENTVGKKLYITGGIGARGSGEAFGNDYELPNMSAYCETCASIGNVYWNHRMFLLHADSKYIDVMERILYNGVLSGVSLDGKLFFYPNPLESNGQHQRKPWFGVACCPGNITRFLASVPGYVYAQQGGKLYVNLFVTGSADIRMDGGSNVRIVQETRYPWDGSVKMMVSPDRNARFAVHVRVPGWARNEPVPSDLYRFSDEAADPLVLKVNGSVLSPKLERGYVILDREWKRNDSIELVLPMTVRRMVAHPQVDADRGRVALQRGPIVYCVEGPDNPEGHVRNLVVSDGATLTTRFEPGLLKGVQVVRGKAVSLAYDNQDRVVRREQDFTAIPYYAWANRGAGEMAVWIPNNESVVKPRPKQTTAWAEDQFFDSNGVQIRYIESGRGEPVVLVHGFSGNLERGWVDRGIFNKLSERYHVIAMDCRGHGKSGKPEDPEQYGAEMARDIVRLLDHLKIERAHIVGYSMGAIITAKLLTMSPDRFLTATLGGAAGFLEWTAEDERRAEGEASKIEQRNKALAAVLRSTRDQVATAGQIAAVRVPTLGIVGSLDPHLASDPAGFRKFQSAMPRLKLVVVEGGDHATTSSRPEFLAALQEFLAAHPAGH